MLFLVKRGNDDRAISYLHHTLFALHSCTLLIRDTLMEKMRKGRRNGQTTRLARSTKKRAQKV
jgi:hypothetical protein